MVANDVARWISLIHRAAYLRCIISLLWRYAPYTFRNRLDLLSILFFFVGFLRRRRKFQLYLSVKCGKFGLKLFQFVLLFHTLPAISCNCGTSFSSTSFFPLYWSIMDGIRSNAFRKLRAAATESAIARCPLL